MRFTEKDKQENHYFVKPINTNVAFDFESRIKADDKLGQLEDVMEKYDFETVEELDKFLSRNVIFGKLHTYK